MLLLILAAGKRNHNTSYKAYPEWATYLAFVVLTFEVYLLWKAKRNNNPKNKK